MFVYRDMSYSGFCKDCGFQRIVRNAGILLVSYYETKDDQFGLEKCDHRGGN